MALACPCAGARRGLVGLVGVARVPGGAPADLHAGRTGRLASARVAVRRRTASQAKSAGSRSRSPDGEEARMRREHWQARWVGALAVVTLLVGACKGAEAPPAAGTSAGGGTT